MNYEPTPDCICGGKSYIQGPGGPANYMPCSECIARWDRTHCVLCEAPLGPAPVLDPRGSSRPCCSRACAQGAIPSLIQERDALRLHIQALEQRLHTLRDPCPGCRCRLLPGETCRCCDVRQNDLFAQSDGSCWDEPTP